MRLNIRGSSRTLIVKSFAYEGRKTTGDYGSQWKPGFDRRVESRSNGLRKTKAMTANYIYTA